MPKEIERKFLIDSFGMVKLGKYKPLKVVYIEQNYLSIGNEEIRIRKVNGDESKFVMTIKSGNGLERDESEFCITEGSYNQISLKLMTPIEKHRYSIECNGVVVEVDIYKNKELDGLIVGEVEFESTKHASEFGIPDWVLKEVTHDKSYKNQSLWKQVNINQSLR